MFDIHKRTLQDAQQAGVGARPSRSPATARTASWPRTPMRPDTGSSTAVEFTLDTIPPAVSITTSGGLTNKASQTISGTVTASEAPVGATVSLYDNGGTTPIGTATVVSGGAWSATVHALRRWHAQHHGPGHRHGRQHRRAAPWCSPSTRSRRRLQSRPLAG